MTQSPSRSVCVFCSSSTTIDPSHVELAADVGSAVASRGWTLVTGGGTVGSMGAIARAARDAGGRTVGVIPRALLSLEVADHEADELVVTDDMRSRKGEMDLRADAFLALPGGLGTLEELLEVWVSRSLAMHAKPVVVLDPDGTYDRLRALVDDLVAREFVRATTRDSLVWTSTVEAALAALEAGWRTDEVPPDPTPEEVLEAEP